MNEPTAPTGDADNTPPLPATGAVKPRRRLESLGRALYLLLAPLFYFLMFSGSAAAATGVALAGNRPPRRGRTE